MYNISTDEAAGLPDTDELLPLPRPNSIHPPRTLARPAKAMEEADNYPVLISGRIFGGDVDVNWSGADRTYTLHSQTDRASKLPNGAMVLVRISKAMPSHAEIYEPSICHHIFLGHALFRASRPA